MLNKKPRVPAPVQIPTQLSFLHGFKDYLIAQTVSPHTRNAYLSDLLDIVRQPDVDVVVEVMGGIHPAYEVIKEAILHGKQVVTANKALLAEHGNELFKLADDNAVQIAYEAAVAGGIPIIKVMREGLAANKINWLAGIINGTGNFILTEMREKGRAFADVLKEAQELGYAEADPTFDVEGIDAAHKLTILASCAFGIPLQFDKVYTEGISKITAQDVKYAEELGFRIKHLGIARRAANGIELRVHPTLIPAEELIANVNGVKNAVLVQAHAVGPTLYYGAGAGAGPTASAVVADVIDIVRDISYTEDGAGTIPQLAFEALTNVPILSRDIHHLHCRSQVSHLRPCSDPTGIDLALDFYRSLVEVEHLKSLDQRQLDGLHYTTHFPWLA